MASTSMAVVIPALSRIDRIAGRTIRERDRKLHAAEHRRVTRAEAATLAARIQRLTRVHLADFVRIDWDDIEATGMVAPAVARDAVSAAARRALADYRPSLFDALFGREREKRRLLTERVVSAAKADAELYGLAKAEADRHNRLLSLAPDIRALNLDAIAGALKADGGIMALKEIVEGLSLHIAGPGRLVVELDLPEWDALPDEIAQPGALAAPMPDEDRARLQLDNAAATVLRAAIEVLRVAPAPAVEVLARLCRPGVPAETEFDPVLHVKVSAAGLAHADLSRTDAVDVIGACGARLDWHPVQGLVPIDVDVLTPQAARTPSYAT